MTNNSLHADNQSNSMLKSLCLVLLVITVFRAYFVSISHVDLFVDEIQYWWWSKELAWGFYSKPPMIAVLIYLVTSVFGDSVFAIKLGAILVYPITTLIIYVLGKKLVSEQVGFWAGVLFITLPGVALSSTITSTDVLLFLFWSSAMLFFIRSIESNRWVDWLICAVLCGLGLLTKYNMAIFAISAIGYLLFFGHIKQLLNPKLWVMAAIALAILAPNFYWNYLNGFPTFEHTAEYVDEKGLYPRKMISFIFEQAGIIGPIGFIMTWWWVIKGKPPKALLLTFCAPIFIVICGVALQGKYNANWAAPTYVAVVIGVAHFLQNHRKWLVAMLSTNLLLGAIVSLADPVIHATGIELKAKQDPYRRVRGWKAWGQELKTYTDQYPQATFIADGRRVITEATFYTFGKPNARITEWTPKGTIESHFQLTRPYKGGKNQVIIVSDKPIQTWQHYFKKVEALGNITRILAIDSSDQYTVYLADGFLGY
jgi:4-amino-4-deoxy-L-arabinose transferase-like glycosyltransferase